MTVWAVQRGRHDWSPAAVTVQSSLADAVVLPPPVPPVHCAVLPDRRGAGTPRQRDAASGALVEECRPEFSPGANI